MPTPHTADGFYATVDRQTGGIRDVHHAEDRQQAYSLLTSLYAPALRAQVSVRRVSVTLLEPIEDVERKNAKARRKARLDTPGAHRGNTWSFSRHRTKGSLTDLQQRKLAEVDLAVFPFLEHDGQVYRRLTTTCETIHRAYEDLLHEGDQQAANEVVNAAQGWEDVNRVIAALREQATGRFGKDFANPAYDE